MNTEPLSEEEETKRGLEIVRVFNLKIAKDDNGKRYNPDRFYSTHGNKTALGVFRTMKGLLSKQSE